MTTPIARSASAGAYARILQAAAQPATHRAFAWLHLHEPRIRQWQRDLVAIPAPPFAEHDRAQWFLQRFNELGLATVALDTQGSVLGWLREPVADESIVLLSAHLDTIFPASTPIDLTEDDILTRTLLRAPGAADNGAGLAALLALIAALRHAEFQPATNILFAANTGEEAEGDLRGMRHLFHTSTFSHNVLASIALEGAGNSTIVTRGLGSRRFRVEITGPGGHAWTDAGTPNPVVALAQAVTALSHQALPIRPRTTINVGAIHGGTSITSIPETASALVDLRSVDSQELLGREAQLFRTVEDAVSAENSAAKLRGPLHFQIVPIGNRPAGALPPNAPILQTVRAVDRHLALRTEERIGSTDANIPIALGRQSIAMGAGGTAGGIHTTAEWYDSTGRELALRRILLVLLDLCSEPFRSQCAASSSQPLELDSTHP